jgi:hypothetical protein
LYFINLHNGGDPRGNYEEKEYIIDGEEMPNSVRLDTGYDIQADYGIFDGVITITPDMGQYPNDGEAVYNPFTGEFSHEEVASDEYLAACKAIINEIYEGAIE